MRHVLCLTMLALATSAHAALMPLSADWSLTVGATTQADSEPLAQSVTSTVHELNTATGDALLFYRAAPPGPGPRDNLTFGAQVEGDNASAAGTINFRLDDGAFWGLAVQTDGLSSAEGWSVLLNGSPVRMRKFGPEFWMTDSTRLLVAGDHTLSWNVSTASGDEARIVGYASFSVPEPGGWVLGAIVVAVAMVRWLFS